MCAKVSRVSHSISSVRVSSRRTRDTAVRNVLIAGLVGNVRMAMSSATMTLDSGRRTKVDENRKVVSLVSVTSSRAQLIIFESLRQRID